MSTHLELQERKALFGRINAFELFEDLKRSNPETELEPVRDYILSLVNREIEKIDDAHLDKWLGELPELVDRALLTFSTHEPTAAMREMAAEFRNRCQALSCRKCAELTSHKKICAGSARDSITVTERGECMAHFKTLFAAAEEIARAYYRTYAAPVLDRRDVNITFSTVGSDDKPHQIPVEFFLTGDTVFQDVRHSAASEVMLRLCIKRFDWQTYLATLYVLLHECVCHAFTGLAANRKRPSRVPYDGFAEGWMDYVVSLILDDLNRGEGPATAIGKSLTWKSMFTVGQDFHRHRIDRAVAPPSVTQAIDGASATYDVLQDEVGAGEGRAVMFRLSLQLNSLSLTDVSVDVRMDAARLLGRYLPRPVPKHHPKKFKITSALREYANGGQIQAFLAKLAVL
jgi:hypothetical protein